MQKVQLYFSIIFLFLSTFYIIYKVGSFNSNLEKEIETYLEVAEDDIKHYQKLTDNFINTLPPDFIYDIWFAEKDIIQQWKPALLYNKKSLSRDSESGRIILQNNSFIDVFDYSTKNYSIKVWYNRMNIFLIIPHILIHLVIIILIYLITLIITRLIYAEFVLKKRTTSATSADSKEPPAEQKKQPPVIENIREPLKYDLTSEEIDALFKEDDHSQK